MSTRLGAMLRSRTATVGSLAVLLSLTGLGVAAAVMGAPPADTPGEGPPTDVPDSVAADDEDENGDSAAADEAADAQADEPAGPQGAAEGSEVAEAVLDGIADCRDEFGVPPGQSIDEDGSEDDPRGWRVAEIARALNGEDGFGECVAEAASDGRSGDDADAADTGNAGNGGDGPPDHAPGPPEGLDVDGEDDGEGPPEGIDLPGPAQQNTP